MIYFSILCTFSPDYKVHIVTNINMHWFFNSIRTSRRTAPTSSHFFQIPHKNNHHYHPNSHSSITAFVPPLRSNQLIRNPVAFPRAQKTAHSITFPSFSKKNVSWSPTHPYTLYIPHTKEPTQHPSIPQPAAITRSLLWSPRRADV